jgi:uncharacterized protein YyaL (SSP411 family)
MLGESCYLTAAERTLRAFATTIKLQPAACPNLLMALQEFLAPVSIVMLRGQRAELNEWKRKLGSYWLPGALLLSLPDTLPSLPAALEHPCADDVNAWLCQGVMCLPAINCLDTLLEKLQFLGMVGKTRL